MARAAPHRAEVSRLYGGIDDDVRQLFFQLGAFELKLVFNVYERQHGDGKRKYAEATFAKWRSGSVQMGGEISERLIRIVPEFLSFDQKYDLIEKLWNRLRQRSTLNVTISPHDGVDGAVGAVMDAIDVLGEHEIPTAVVERLEWLAQDDSVAARALLGQIAKHEAEIAVETLEGELRQLLALAAEHHDKVVTASRTVTLPGVTVYITVSQAARYASRRPTMTDMEHESKDNDPAPLARRDDDQSQRDLAPIQNPNDLLNEAFRRISPQKQEQIIGKVAEELGRIQVKRAEGHADHEMAASKIDQVVEGARRVDENRTFTVEGEHRSEHGYVKISVRDKPAPLAERVGKCFVATACYGDSSHPAVLFLRRFRDQCLRNNSVGRSFIAWYYQYGPRFAERIERRPDLQLAGRFILWPVAIVAAGATWISFRILHGRDDHMPR